MRTIRIYHPGCYQQDEDITLSLVAAHHVAVVLRLQAGQTIFVFNGFDQQACALLTTVDKKKVIARLTTIDYCSRESPCELHLVQGLAKGARMDIVVQKAVELGVTSIRPLITAHCSVKIDAKQKAKKQAHWQAIAISACEQSGRNTLAIIHPVTYLTDFLAIQSTHLKFVLSPTSLKSWRNYTFTDTAMTLLVGPEGGLSSQELTALTTYNFMPLSLGPRILRTETAAIAALTLLQAMGGDL